MPDQYLYTYKRSTFDNPSEVIFINQKEIAELDNFFSSHLDEVTELFADYGLNFIYLPALLTPEFVKGLLDYHAPGLSDERRETIMAQATPANVYRSFFDEEYRENPYKLMSELDLFFSELDSADPICPTNRNTWERTKYTGLVWAANKHLAPPLTEYADEEGNIGRYRTYHFAELKDSDDGVLEQLDHFFRCYFPMLYDFIHHAEISFSDNVSFISEDEGAITMHNADTPQTSDDDADDLVLYNVSGPQESEPDETDGDPKQEQVQELSKFERALKKIRDSEGHGIILSRISKNSSIGLPNKAESAEYEKMAEEMHRRNLASISSGSLRCYTRMSHLEADDLFTQEAYQLSQEIIERVEKLRKIGVNELIISSLLTSEVKLSRLCITEDYRILLPDYNDKEIVMGPLPKAVFLLFLRHPEGIMFKLMSEWKNELLGLYCRCSRRQPDEEMRQSVEKLTDPLSNSLNEKCSRIREAFLREMDDSIASHYYITGDRATPKRIQLDRELVEWGK